VQGRGLKGFKMCNSYLAVWITRGNFLTMNLNAMGVYVRKWGASGYVDSFEIAWLMIHSTQPLGLTYFLPLHLRYSHCGLNFCPSVNLTNFFNSSTFFVLKKHWPPLYPSPVNPINLAAFTQLIYRLGFTDPLTLTYRRLYSELGQACPRPHLVMLVDLMIFLE